MIIFYIVILYICFCSIIGIILVKHLDKLTSSLEDEYMLSTKYYLIFIYCNIFCLLFIKQIKHSRKFDYYKTYIKNRENCHYYMYKDDTKYILYKRLLKLEKLK